MKFEEIFRKKSMYIFYQRFKVLFFRMKSKFLAKNDAQYFLSKFLERYFDSTKLKDFRTKINLLLFCLRLR